ncbi:MAG: hypothetical protein IIA45_03105 [Bacteroidetes bacterium]|nr:hypothetical protein [Bacteroidota bacterium]
MKVKLIAVAIILFIITSESSLCQTIDEVLSLRSYTDFIGFSKDEPNGIVQFELKGHFVLINTKNSKGNHRIVTPLHNLYITPRLTKIGKNELNILLNFDPTQKISHIHTLDLWKHSNAAIGGNLNLLTFNLFDKKNGKNNEGIMFIYVDFTTHVITTAVRDTLTSFTLSSSIYGTSVKFKIQPRNIKLALDIGFTVNNLRLLDSEIEQRYGKNYRDYPLNNAYDNSIYKNLLGTNEYGWFFVPQMELIYTAKLNQRYYFRASFYNNFNKQNNFLQLQFGVEHTPKSFIALFN